jgi:hypothetical protein
MGNAIALFVKAMLFLKTHWKAVLAVINFAADLAPAT